MVKRPAKAIYQAITAVMTPKAPPATLAVALALKSAAASRMKVTVKQKNSEIMATEERWQAINIKAVKMVHAVR